MAKIIPGILTADEEDYRKKLMRAENVTDLVQIDVVDGIFADNKTVGVEIIKKYPTSSQLEIQLMVVNPLDYVDELVGLEYVRRIIFAFEVDGDINENIYHIKKHNKQVGISLNPETPVRTALNFLDETDLLSLYAGRPGYSGQKFQEGILDKIKEAKNLVAGLAVEVDIGVNEETIPKIVVAGADFLVVTSALHNAPDFYVAFEKLAKLASKTS